MTARSTALALAGVALSLSLARSASTAAQFRSGVEMVPLTVTVTNQSGRYVSDLTAGDFTIFEDGKPQKLAYFASDEAPADVALLLDVSSSMHEDLRLAQEAACGLARRLRPGDRAGVTGIGSTPVIAQTMTPDVSRVEQAIRSMHAFGATAIYEGIYIVLRDFQRAKQPSPEIRRQAIVLLSDGLDTASHIPFDHVYDTVRRGDVTIYVVLLERNLDVAADGEDSSLAFEARFAMRSLARESGGRIFTPQSAGELPAVYEAIADELGRQYVLGYVPAREGGDGLFRRISVGVRHPHVTQARTRAGYYANLPRPAHLAPRASR